MLVSNMTHVDEAIITEVINEEKCGDGIIIVYFWIRRFEGEAERERLYKEIYQSGHWLNELVDRVGEVMDKVGMVVHRVVATALSPMQ